DAAQVGASGIGGTAPAAQVVEREAVEQRDIEAARARVETTVHRRVVRSRAARSAIAELLVSRGPLGSRDAAIAVDDVELPEARIGDAVATIRVERIRSARIRVQRLEDGRRLQVAREVDIVVLHEQTSHAGKQDAAGGAVRAGEVLG